MRKFSNVIFCTKYFLTMLKTFVSYIKKTKQKTKTNFQLFLNTIFIYVKLLALGYKLCNILSLNICLADPGKFLPFS